MRGPSIATGYWSRTVATQKAFRADWLRTGDVYTRSEDGYFTFLGRNNDMIKAGGIWVSPAEVEAVLVEHPDVLEAAVVGSRDPHGLETTVAFVVPRSGHHIDHDAIDAHCRERMAAFKRPRPCDRRSTPSPRRRPAKSSGTPCATNSRLSSGPRRSIFTASTAPCRRLARPGRDETAGIAGVVLARKVLGRKDGEHTLASSAVATNVFRPLVELNIDEPLGAELSGRRCPGGAPGRRPLEFGHRETCRQDPHQDVADQWFRNRDLLVEKSFGPSAPVPAQGVHS